MVFTTPPPLGDDQALAIAAPSRPADATTLRIGRDRLGAPHAVAGFGYDFGHTDPSFPFPIGAVATLDPTGGALRFGPE